MTVRDLRYEDGLDTFWEELVYTEAQLEAEPLAHGLVKPVKGLIDRWESVGASRRSKWRAEIRAQADVDRADAKLDRAVVSVADDLLDAVGKDRNDPRFVRYFPVAPSAVVRMGLEAELKRVRTWPEALSDEPERALKEQAKPLAKIIAEGDAAIEARDAAMGDTANQRVREIVRFVDDANAVRLSVWNALLSIAMKEKLGKTWPDGFFRKSNRGSVRSESEPAPAPEPAPKPAP